MNLISKISAATILLFSFSSCNAQIKNTKTESVKIYGNCEMCEKTIETAGSVKKIANVDWNKDTKMATITYDSTKTNQDEILKRIAWLVMIATNSSLQMMCIVNLLDVANTKG